MKKFLLIVFVAASLYSCNTIMMKAYGMSEPKEENESTLLSYLKKRGLATNNVYAYDAENYNTQIKNIKGKIPEVVIFNSKGEYIPYGDEYACNASAFDFIEKLDRNAVYKTSDAKSWDVVCKGLINLKGEPATIERNGTTDYYVVLYWAKFSGRLNKDHVKVWEDQAKNNKTATIKVVKVCLDPQESWNAGDVAKDGK